MKSKALNGSISLLCYVEIKYNFEGTFLELYHIRRRRALRLLGADVTGV